MSVSTGTVEAIISEFKLKAAAQVSQPMGGPGIEPRGAHPHHHGIATAEFRVWANLGPELGRGLFARPKEYPAYVRFSNAGGAPSDSIPDFRGMAIKVMGVEGERLLVHEIPEDEANTQDFHLTNLPVFFAHDPEDLHDFLVLRRKIREAGSDKAAAAALNQKLATDFPVIQKAGVIQNPFRVAYFSQTPYALGNGCVVKYQARPRVVEAPLSQEDLARTNPTAFYLQDAMVETLKGGEDVVFDFMVQRQTDPIAMPIDDPRIDWDQGKSPFVPVATITIRADQNQDFMSAERMRFAEDISFSPWHGLKEHRPVGRLNDARREAYRQMAKHRHDTNHVAYKEPTGRNDF